jgi:hypothetical protein
MVRESNLTEAAAAREDLPDPRDVVGRDEEIPIRELFDDEFVRAHTAFETFDEMVAASPSPADTADELELIPDGEWDAFVAETTAFADEEELVFAAIDTWVARQLDLDVNPVAAGE